MNKHVYTSNTTEVQHTPDVAETTFQTHSSEPTPALYFYLHQTVSRGNIKRLIPLEPNKSIAEAVRGRVLLEFPTIYVLVNGPHNLPEGFALERVAKGSSPDKETPDETQLNLNLSDAARPSAEVCLLHSDSNELPDKAEQILKVDEDDILRVLQQDLQTSA
ncbi:MAG: hypothetical protein Q9227_005267 [Pyrenula ochraceoflavens]